MVRSKRELLLHLFLAAFATIAASNPVLIEPAIELLCPAASDGGVSPRCFYTVATIGANLVGGILGYPVGLALKKRASGGGVLSSRRVYTVITIGAVVNGGIVGSVARLALKKAASEGDMLSSRCVNTVITICAVAVGGSFGRFVGLALKELLASGGTMKKAGHVAIPDGK